MNCKVYNQRPIACRIAGHDCLGDFWVKTIKERHEKNKTVYTDEAFEEINIAQSQNPVYRSYS